MIQGIVEACHHLNGEDEVEILRVPIRLTRLDRPRHDATGVRTTSHLHASSSELVAERRQETVGYLTMDQEGLHSITHTRTLHFGVKGHSPSHRQISLIVDIRLTQPFFMFSNSDV